MTDALMRNLDALKMCILGINIEDEQTLARIKDKNKIGVEIEEDTIYPDVDTALKVASAKTIEAVKEEREKYRERNKYKVLKLIDIETKEEQIFENLTQIAKYAECSVPNVSYCVRNNRKIKDRYIVEKVS